MAPSTQKSDGIRRPVAAIFLVATMLAACSADPAFRQESPDTRILVLAFDGLSLESVTGDDGRIDAGRFPHLASLADTSSFLTSVMAVSDDVEDSFESFVRGSSASEEGTGTSLCDLLSDREIAWNDSSCDQQTGQMGQISVDRAQRFRRFLQAIDATRPAHYVFRSSLPDAPWRYLADGRYYRAQLHEIPGSFGEFWGSRPTLIEQGRHRHQEQLRFLDSLLGELLERLAELSILEGATVALIGTRGISFLPGEKIQHLSEGNVDSILRIPVLIKTPGQKVGATVEDPLSLAEIPTWIAEMLSREPVQPGTRSRRHLESRGLHHSPFSPVSEQGGRLSLKARTLEPGGSIEEPAQVPTMASERRDLLEPNPRSAGGFGRDASVSLIGNLPPNIPASEMPVLLSGRIVGAHGEAPVIDLEINGRIVDRIESYGPEGGEFFFSFLGSESWTLHPSNEVAFLMEGPQGETIRLPRLGPAQSSTDDRPSCDIHAYSNRTVRIRDEISLQGWAIGRSIPRETFDIEIYSGGRSIYVRHMTGLSEGVALDVRIPFAWAPNFEDDGLRAVLSAPECRSKSLLPVFRVHRKGLEIETIERGDGRLFRIEPGEIVGMIETIGERWGGVLLAGWAADLDSALPAERILVVEGDRVISDQSLEVERWDVATTLQEEGLAMSGFEFVVTDDSGGDWSVIAVRGQKASPLAATRIAGENPRLSPRMEAPKVVTGIFSSTLVLDAYRELPIRGDRRLGWVDEVSRTETGWRLRGWAGDPETGKPGLAVYAFQAGRIVSIASVEGMRQDVADSYGEPGLARSGFELNLPPGRRDYRLLATSSEGWAAEIEGQR